MATIKALYGTSNQALTWTLTSLSNAAAQQSTVVDNTSNLFLDALVFVKLKTGASGVSANGYVDIYAYGTADGGTTYSDGATGSNGSISPTSPPNLMYLGRINCVADSTTYEGGPFSVANAFGGLLPDHWGLVLVNNTGATLDASVGSGWYQGTQQTVA